MPTDVRVTGEGPVRTLTLDGPGRLNALGETALGGLRSAVDALRDDIGVRVVVVGGAGPSFSAGADLKDAAPSTDSWFARSLVTGRWQRVLADLQSLPQVTVAALHGWVIGGASLLAAACDIRVAADDTRVRIPEVPMGIPLTWAGLPLLVREIGLPATRDLVMTGRTVEADEALRLGLVQRVVPVGTVDAAAAALAAELAATPAGALMLTKRSLAALGEQLAPSAHAWADADLLAWSNRDPEAREAMATYRERTIGRS